MKPRLHAHEEVHAGLIRLTDAQVADARHRILHPTPDRSDDVHAVRVAIKRLRALWRLLKPVCDQWVWNQENQHLRDAAQSLATQRDGVVIKQVLDDLRARAKDYSHRWAVESLREHLTDLGVLVVDAQSSRDTEAAMRRAGQILLTSLDTMRTVELSALDWGALEPGLSESWSALDRWFHRAYDKSSTADDSAFHELRKRVKRVHFQLELARRAWPARLQPILRSLKKLGVKLGDDHDVVMLRSKLAALPEQFAVQQELRLVDAALARRSRRLRQRAQTLAAEILSQGSDDFIAHLGKHWRHWHADALHADGALTAAPSDLTPALV